MKLKFFVLPAAAVAAASMLVAPREVVGFTTIGGSLSQAQRDVRVFDNFGDSTANNNTTPHISWPGYTGAELAIWKAVIEWSSEPHGGTGAGDPTQPIIGDGGANFDPSWQGNATGVGGTNDNIHSELGGSSGGVLAFMEGPISDGWRIRYYANWTWDDGPGSITFGRYDIQSVACHEYGHALGLGHSANGGATMWGSIGSGSTAQRSINSDDQAGVQFIYGVASATKPRITSINLSGGQLTINGNDFAATDNEVWFTQAGTGGDGTPIKATGLDSNGFTIVTGIPGNAGSGDILVKKGGVGGNSGLSNPFPFDSSGVAFPPATSVNIDLGVSQGVPGTGQGGAAGNVGSWNGIAVPTGGTGLLDLDQFQTNGTFSHTGTAGEFTAGFGGANGFWKKLFDDGHDVGCVGTPFVTYQFDGFQAGTYDVYVYSWALENPANSLTDIEVLGGNKGKQTCGGLPYQTNLVDGGNYVVDQVTITAGQPILVTAERNAFCARINGFQILPGAACGVSTNYCTSGTSASGCQASLSSSGVPSATAASGFTIQADGVEGQKDGLFFYGVNGKQANSWGSSSSFQCVKPPVLRAGLIPGNGNVGVCDGTFQQDLNALWNSNPAKNPGTGTAVNAQLWYRDPQNTSTQTTRLSDGLSFTVCP
jgi:hypothetical protein